MPYDHRLAARIRGALSRRRGVTERAMFGGLGYLVQGNMALGIWREALIARVGPSEYSAALREPGVREFNITGRAMTGWVLVTPEALETDDDLQAWVARCLKFVRTLPAKPSTGRAAPRRGRS